MTPIYNNFKEKLVNGTIDLDDDVIRIALVSDSPAYSPDIDNEVYVNDVLDGGSLLCRVGSDVLGWDRQIVPLRRVRHGPDITGD